MAWGDEGPGPTDGPPSAGGARLTNGARTVNAARAPDAATTPTKPVILAVDDDAPVLAAVARDLRRAYGARFAILRTTDSAEALATLQRLVLDHRPVALVVADQRMPGLSGVELLERARTLHDGVRTVLLTAYADTDAAIDAINKVSLDHYILKPWDPPEEHLYPVLDELLDEWEAAYEPEFRGVRLVGHRWSPEAHDLREFMARNLVPFRWVDVERDAEDAHVLQEAAGDPELPFTVLPDGAVLATPTPRALAEAIGLRAPTVAESFDLVVVGAGPAGLAAAVYGASEGLRTAVLEASALGGQAGSSSRIENYLGFPTGVSGAELTRRAVDQARRLGAHILSPATVDRLRRAETYHLLHLDDGGTLSARAVILACGVAYRTLDVDGAEDLQGRGVFYGASMHEAQAFRDEAVAIVGGGNSAGQAALHFARYARSVDLLVRAPSLTASMSAYLIDQIAQTPAITVRYGTQVAAARGNGHLDHLEIRAADGTLTDLPASGAFIFIGAAPRTEWAADALARDSHGFVLAGRELRRPQTWKERREPFSLETSRPGVFAAGDVRSQSVKRVASAVGDGAIAVHLVHQYLGL